ncbi:extracellular solute-binding protein [Rhizomonospora bruguierae]|uniref:extracellular solute-binding protein n=1 Tax=Rhizomonospora bruguierae TaxID=1581705 RepID=UPI0020BF4BDE|nr:extracellular solute-binding protein [Micromonospora sp. NBRC 107566]
MRTLRWLAAASALALLAGCGGGSGGDGAGADTGKLTVWMMGEGGAAQNSFLDSVKAEFTTKHPDTEVDVQYIPWLEAPKKFATALAGGSGGPDITELGNTETQGWAAQDALADLTDKLAGWSEGKDLLPNLVKNAQLDGKQYGIPWYAGVRAIYYRADWFGELDVKPPTTWAELVTAARTVQEKKKGVYGFAVPGNSELPFYSFLWGAGGEIATRDGDTWKSGYDTPAARKAVDFWTGLVTREKVAPPAAATWTEVDAQKQFATGTAAMTIAGSWSQTSMLKANPDIDKSWGTVPIPGEAGGAAPAFAGGSDIAIWKDSKRQELAWDYLTILLNKQNNQKWADSLKFFPVHGDLVSGGTYTSDKIMAAFATAMQNTRLTPITPQWVEVSRNRSVTQTMNSSVMKGQKTVDQAVKEAATEMDQLLNKK